jgi:tetratricopeptide (TPR) repeat protein
VCVVQARTLIALQCPEQAVTAAVRATELSPTDGFAHSTHGRALVLASRFEDAVGAFEKALANGLEDVTVLIELAWFLATFPDPRPGFRARAVELAEEAKAIAPRDHGMWATLGVAPYEAGRHEESLAALKQSLELRKGGDAFPWFFYAMAKHKLGHPKAIARSYYDMDVVWMEEHKPDDKELKRFRAEAEKVLGIQKD